MHNHGSDKILTNRTFNKFKLFVVPIIITNTIFFFWISLCYGEKALFREYNAEIIQCYIKMKYTQLNYKL